VPAKSHARERALVDAQLDPVGHPQVRGDAVSLREHDEVAHDKLPRWEVVVGASVPQYGAGVRHKVGRLLGEATKIRRPTGMECPQRCVRMKVSGDFVIC
jgi:hypothetical protein